LRMRRSNTVPTDATEGARRFVKSIVTNPLAAHANIQSKLDHKAVVAEHVNKSDSAKLQDLHHKPVRRRKVMPARERRANKLFELQPEQLKYDSFLPLHQLWVQYMNDLLKACTPATAGTRIMKIDLAVSQLLSSFVHS